MATIKKYNGSSWENVVVRKFGTATEAVENPLYSDGTAITSYTLKGNTVQNGTPTPSNPVEVNGVGVRTENIIDTIPVTSGSMAYMNYENTNDSQSIRCYGTSEAYTQRASTRGYTLPAGTYTLSFVSTRNNSRFFIQLRSSAGTTTYASTLDNPTFTLSEATEVYPRVCGNFSSANPYTTDEVISIMLNTGSTDKPYEPHGYKTPISNGQQTIDIYIGDLPLLKSLDGTAVDEISNGTLTRRVDADGSVLPTPTTTQITMPSIPTTKGANSITVDTTVQPSEFTATWTGWHDATVKEWDGSIWG